MKPTIGISYDLNGRMQDEDQQESSSLLPLPRVSVDPSVVANIGYDNDRLDDRDRSYVNKHNSLSLEDLAGVMLEKDGISIV